MALGFFVAATGCQRDDGYFGNTKPPPGQHFVYVNAIEPSSLDPAVSMLSAENNIWQSLLEGLVNAHPITGEPIAGMATHYEVSPNGCQYTFFLRGHPRPRGSRLPNIDALPKEFSHGVLAPPDSLPAHWSDGSIVTAHDFVYAWRRLVDPKFAYITASDLSIVENGAEITAGKRTPEQLGVQAVDDFTLIVHLQSPVPYFLALARGWPPVPRRTVESFYADGRENDWTKPANFVGNGPFVLSEWRPYDRVTIRKSPTWYLADLVRLDDVTFLPVGAGAASVSLFRSGAAQALFAQAMPSSIVPALRSKSEFVTTPGWGIWSLAMNLRDPPFDNPVLRIAMNMAIDKSALASFSGTEPLKHLTTPASGYSPQESIFTTIGGKRYDILAYNPDAAREALTAAGYPGGKAPTGRTLGFDIWTIPNESYIELAQIIAYQLSQNLNVQARVSTAEGSVLWDGQFASHFSGMELTEDGRNYGDPYAFLGYMPSPGSGYILGWEGTAYFSALEAANGTLEPAARLKRLADCEAMLMQDMPIIPLMREQSNYLLKPYVCGWTQNPGGDKYFMYVWIDHDWQKGKTP